MRLSAVHWAISVVVVALVLFVWYGLLKRVLAFGRNIDYSGLEALGVQAVALLNQYNPYFWWVIVALCTLIIAYFLFGFVQAMRRRARARLVSESVIADLRSTLSPAAIDVLRWTWHNKREPITVGDLQRSLAEIQHGRAEKIALARRHAALLRDTTPPVTLTQVDPVTAAPIIGTPASDTDLSGAPQGQIGAA